jgi:hypothetical protein
VPWITLNGLLSITLSIWLLRNNVWTARSRFAEIGLKLISIGIVIAVLRGPDLLVAESNTAFAEGGRTIASLGNNIIPWLLLLSILGTTVEIGKIYNKLFRTNIEGAE